MRILEEVDHRPWGGTRTRKENGLCEIFEHTPSLEDYGGKRSISSDKEKQEHTFWDILREGACSQVLWWMLRMVSARPGISIALSVGGSMVEFTGGARPWSIGGKETHGVRKSLPLASTGGSRKIPPF